MDPELLAAYPTALDLAAAIRSRAVSPTEVMEATLAAIDNVNPSINAVVWHDPDDARRRAADATDRVARDDPDALPPFLGVPIPIKDLNHVAGWPATYGSPGADDAPVDDTALTVQRLVDAGFVLCGRTNTPEFGTTTVTENTRHGVTRNPWNLDHTPGGSSGGAAASVAGGMFTIAHASDGGGSIRIPATCTGLVGLKPSRGRVNDATMSWEGASTQGVLTHSVADTAAALDILGVPDPLSWYNAPAPDRPFVDEVGASVERLRIRPVLDVPFGLDMDPECAAAVERTVAALADAGHDIVDAPFDAHLDEFMLDYVKVVNASLLDYDVDWDRVQGPNRANRRYAEEVDSLHYVAAVRELQRWSRRVNAQWGDGFDILLTPTMVTQPPKAGVVLDAMLADPGHTPMDVVRTVLFTSQFNMNGLPAISLPVHQAASGLPVGIQLVAGPWQDAGLLRLAAQVEQLLPWADRRADLGAAAAIHD